jgi:hypothetical protein
MPENDRTDRQHMTDAKAAKRDSAEDRHRDQTGRGPSPDPVKVGSQGMSPPPRVNGGTRP